MFEIDASEAWDIDENVDFLFAEYLIKDRNSNQE
jgi:CMP-N-acetylneuraminic acid synthetase